MTKFIVFKSPVNEQWYFHFVSPNGKIVAQSEGYKRKSSAVKAVACLRAGAAGALTIVREDGRRSHR